MPSTAEEQYLLELTNEARLDPLRNAGRYIASYAPLRSSQADIGQALSYFGVDGAQLLAAYQALTPVMPVAFSDVLAGGARAHDTAMIAANTQAHQLPGEADPFARMTSEGYRYVAAAENVYAYAQNILYAHAGFMVDWGGTAATGGMQSPPGHRADIMGAAYREVGIGAVASADASLTVGPELVTEDFGWTGMAGSFVLGVAYTDLNGNDFYDVGEGQSGLLVTVGANGCVSTESGGYTLQTYLTGLQTLQLSGAGLAGTVNVQLALTDGAGQGVNVKLDVVDGTRLKLSASAVVSGAVSAVEAIGVQKLAITLADGIGRTLLGNSGGDALTGGAGNDAIMGGAGNDTIDGGDGANTLGGGGGEDTAVFDFASATANIRPSGAGWVVDAGSTHDVLTGFAQYRFTDRTVGSLQATPDPLVDRAYYLAGNPDVAAAGIDPYQHYLTYGGLEGRSPDAWFDGAYYLRQNPDVRAAGMNPLLHYEAFGWHEGRAPSLLFDGNTYLAANPDAAAAGMDPLLHYIGFGQWEGRPAFLSGGSAPADPLVEAAYYDPQLGATLLPTGPAAAQQAAWSFDAVGWQRGLNPDPLFDTAFYLSHNPDVAAAHIDPLLHYEAFGWREGRDPSAAFDTGKYLAANPDVKAAGMDPLLHYVAFGQAEGRPVFPV